MKNIQKVLSCLGILALAVFVMNPVSAGQAFGGYSGLLLTPTAEALSQGEMSLGIYGVDADGGDVTVYAGTVGLAKGIEVGYDRVKPDGSSGEDYFNAKYRFAPETNPTIAVAVGVLDIFDEVDSSPYVVLGKTISVMEEPAFGEVDALRVTVGVGSGRLDGVFGGVSAVLGQRLTLMGEYDTENVNFGARFAISDEFRLHAALFDGDNFGYGLSWNKRY